MLLEWLRKQCNHPAQGRTQACRISFAAPDTSGLRRSHRPACCVAQDAHAHTWTVIRRDGPNPLGMLLNGPNHLGKVKLERVHSSCAEGREEKQLGRTEEEGEEGRGGARRGEGQGARDKQGRGSRSRPCTRGSCRVAQHAAIGMAAKVWGCAHSKRWHVGRLDTVASSL